MSATPTGGRTEARTAAAWRAAATVPDPELPALSICDLGIVRDIVDQGDALDVVLTPTYSGCPATEVIENDVRDAIERAGLGPVRIVVRRAPAWTTDWISADGLRKLEAHGIAAPGPAAQQPVRFASDRATAPRCPRCGSSRTEELSRFGSTACKALHRCLACREPFEYLRPF